jgi:hypothetical protein
MSATATPTPVDYVRGLPPQDKQAVFLALIREIILVNGEKGLIPVDDESGLPFGYYVPPEAAAAIADRDLPKLTPEREQELRERMTRLRTAIPISQVIAELKQQAEQLQKQQP